MKKAAILFSIIILCSMTLAQGPSLEWGFKIGNTGSDVGSAIEVDNVGNIYCTGNYDGNVDFDPGTNNFSLNSIIFRDAFVAKYNPLGQFVWAISLNGNNTITPTDIHLDAAGNVLVAGFFFGTVDFDPLGTNYSLTSAGSQDGFIAKFDSEGEFIWAIHIGSAGQEDILSIQTDSQNNIIFGGTYSSTCDFDPGAGVYNLTTTTTVNGFIAKINANGNFIWAKNIGSSGNNFEDVRDLEIDGLDNVVAIGRFTGTCDFDPNSGVSNLTSLDQMDVFILKLDGNGNFIWVNKIGSVGQDMGLCVAIDAFNNVVVSGQFDGSCDLNPGSATNNFTSAGSYDVFVVKLTDAGAYIWAKSFGGSSSEYPENLVISSDGNIFISGDFSNTADFDPGTSVFNLTSLANSSDFFLMKLNSNGIFQWAQKFGDTQSETGGKIAVSNSESIYFTAGFNNTIDFDPLIGVFNLISTGQSDAVILKLNECTPIQVTETITSCDSYTWINGVSYNSSISGLVYQTQSISGCDSIITLNLTINESSQISDVKSACGSYTWINGTTYTTSNNTATYTLTNAVGCDSVIHLNLTLFPFPSVATSTSQTTISANQSGASYQWINCNNANLSIGGATNQSYNAATNGSYAVIVTQNGCSDTSACTVVSNVGMDYIELARVQIFPNPSSSTIHFQAEEAIASIQLTDMNGRILATVTPKANQSELDVSQLNKGIYFVKIQTVSGKTSSQKISKH